MFISDLAKWLPAIQPECMLHGFGKEGKPGKQVSMTGVLFLAGWEAPVWRVCSGSHLLTVLLARLTLIQVANHSLLLQEVTA